MGNKKVPDAWDDDWEAAVDKAPLQEPVQESPGGQPVKSKAERLAEHRELNRQIWQEAETPPEVPFHVAASSNVPFSQGFKPHMKLLSRKPMIKTRDPVTGLEKMTLQDDGDEDDEANKKPQPTPEEIRERQQREREEKERSYDEARARIFGESPSGAPSGTPSGASTPGNTTPPLAGEGGGRGNYRGRGRGRGGRGGRGGQRNDSYRNENKSEVQERRQVNTNGSPYRELFDPTTGSRPNSRQQRVGGGTASPTRGPEAAIRNPRGPDNSGRGGFGFARRGAKEG